MYVAPQLLPKEKPLSIAHHWGKSVEERLYFRYQFPYYHGAIIQNFLAKTGPLAQNFDDGIWRNGIWLIEEVGGAEALIEGFPENRSIVICTQGHEAKRLLDKIRNEFRDLQTEDSKVEEHYSLDGKHYFHYDIIQKAIQEGVGKAPSIEGDFVAIDNFSVFLTQDEQVRLDLNKEKLQPKTQIMRDHSQILIEALENELRKQYNLIAEYRGLILTTKDPRTKLRYKEEIDRCEKGIDEIKNKYLPQLKQEKPQASEGDILQEIQASEYRIKQHVQTELQTQLSEQNKVILLKIDQSHQSLAQKFLVGMQQQQAEMIPKLLDSIERKEVAGSEVMQMLQLLQDQISKITFPEKAEVQAALGDIDLSPKSKLKLALPIIPTILAWETEFEVGWSQSIPQAWQEFRSFFKPKRAK